MHLECISVSFNFSPHVVFRHARWQLRAWTRRHRRLWIAARLGLAGLAIVALRRPQAGSPAMANIRLIAAHAIAPGAKVTAADVRMVAVDAAAPSLVNSDAVETLNGAERATRAITAGQILGVDDITVNGGPVVAQLQSDQAVALPSDVIHPDVVPGDALVLHVLIDGPNGPVTQSLAATTVESTADSLVVALSPRDAPMLAQALTVGQVIVAVEGRDSEG
jgi:hypothetical protein